MFNFLVEKYLPAKSKSEKMTKKAIELSDGALKDKTKEAHYKAAVAHLKAYDKHKQEHLKHQQSNNVDVYAYNRSGNLANAHYKKFLFHKKFTDWG